MRAVGIDEPPQILNILNGTMSLVDPCSGFLDWLDGYPEDIKVFIAVRSGATEYSQTCFRNSADGTLNIKNDAYLC